MSMQEEIALASYVALRVDGWESWTSCPAWVESADRKCGRELIDGTLLCKRHRTVAVSRQLKAAEKANDNHAKKAAYRAEMLPRWREKLARVEADIERYGASPVSDRAAVGGATHPAVMAAQARHLSDSNVERMAGLWRTHRLLTDLIGGDE